MPQTRDERNAYYRIYHAAHKVEIAAYRRIYRATHKAERNAYQRIYNSTHKAEAAARNREHPRQQVYDKARRQNLRLEILAHYGTKCTCCGETTPEFLTIDHVNNDGAEQRKSKHRDVYKWLKAQGYPDGFQVLCYNCNISKGHYGECPHEKQRRVTP